MKRIMGLVAMVGILGAGFVMPAKVRAEGVGGLVTPVTLENLDAGAYAQWVDGAEEPIVAAAEGKDEGHRPQWILWTTKGNPGHSGFSFGASSAPGPRHLRIGFKAEVAVGSILLRAAGRVSVLKPDAVYPGNLADESQWISADRIKDGQVSRAEGGRDNYILWTLPSVIKTRAIRFTHDAQVTEKDYAGNVQGAYVLAERIANIATQAMAVTGSNELNAKKLNNEQTDPSWEQWSNINYKTGERPTVVSEANPEWVMLVWNAPVKLRGVGTCFAGFAQAEAQAYEGPADVHPREAAESAWKTIARFSGLKNHYPTALGADWLDFGKEVTTRALRLRITRGLANGGHPHTQSLPKEGKRVWIGELLALMLLGESDSLKTAVLPAAGAAEKPPIAVKFTLPEAGWVTLVIEDATGKRVRNLIAETYFEKGENTAWWDGSDDLGRDPSAASHGLYYIPTQLVTPGNYKVRGLWRKQVDVKYEFGVYSAGTTPWETGDHSGGWLSNHTPPSAVLYVPRIPAGKEAGAETRQGMLIGSYVSEGTAGLAWTDLEGKKWRGQGWVGGTWTGAPYLARDDGPKAQPDIYAYVAAAWTASTEKKKAREEGEIRLTALTAGEDRPIAKYTFIPTFAEAGDASWATQIGGIAARDGIVAISMTGHNKIILVDVAGKKVIGETEVQSPRGLAFDSKSRLLAISGTRIVRFAPLASGAKLESPDKLIELEAPTGLALDAQGNIYISDRGQSHQVKVFDPDGKALRAIGNPGAPKAGPYDPNHMNNPRGITIDPRGRIWVAEEDAKPKRVSVWSADGKLERAFYGSAEYGGGGSIDPLDKTKFYYNGMEFKLDWEKGTNQLASVFYRPGPDDLHLSFRAGTPQNATYMKGQRYWTNAYNSNPTGGHGTAFVFIDRDGIAVPCAAIGRANDWPAFNTIPSIWPAGTDPKGDSHGNKAAFFVWSDLNGNGLMEENEVKLQKGSCGGVTVMRDLSMVVSRLEGKAARFAPKSFTDKSVPIYDLAAVETLVDGVNTPPSSGGDQALADVSGWSVHTTAPKPYKGSAIGGADHGNAVWSYPSLWPGLHASHEAPVPDRLGEIIGHTRLLGDFFSAGGQTMFAINGNCGPMYVFTSDGLFVAQLFQDMRLGKPWRMPAAQRGMLLNELTPGDENFWPNLTQTADGKVYIAAGGSNAIVRVDGLETVKRIAAMDLNVTADDLDKAREFYARAEAARQAAQGRRVLAVAMREAAPKVDGKMEDWADALWVDIDKRGTNAYFNSKSEAYNVTGAVAIAGDKLFAAWRTRDKDLLKNAGDVPNAPFKTGGALDLMIGTDPAADPKRGKPVNGDLRLLVTQVAGKTRALLYRPVASGEKSGVAFSSPGRTITFDRVEDVSAQVSLAGDDGNFEISIPLAVLGLKPTPGQTINGDIGILRGSGTMTTQRVYWSNKATAIVADVPSEAELLPRLWGRWEFAK